MASVIGEAAPRLFNSPAECGVRALIILNALLPLRLDMSSLCLYDYFVVHPQDIEGPESVHPALASRPGEYRVRRTLVEAGVALMRRLHLVDVFDDVSGILYGAADDGPAFVDLLSTPYNVRLKASANWLAERTRAEPEDVFETTLRSAIERWTLQFEFEVPAGRAL
ncbi:ABC-three component system middle component 2 [Methylobacterium sp. GC_Met_2]|uniref:ABC-three component system middle component 2 n=1 Tax=Methylobacterium sp. GC_Met_2 TaxID=2937376 RepID=UPI00226B2522|nr:ABC-three component system middle component 2 [Methylobacterium sp. GC_Met_2]